jgi:hypothetical protein
VDIAASFRRGLSSLRFDAQPPIEFAPQNLPNGNYRVALEVFRGDILLARIDLYQFTLSEKSPTRTLTLDPPLVIIQP